MKTALLLLAFVGACSAIRFRMAEEASMGECEGRNHEALYVEDGGKRHLHGPVIFFHISSHNGRGFAQMAGNNGMKSSLYGRWDGVLHNSIKDHDVWGEHSWTDLEDNFGAYDPKSGPKDQHNLDELKCSSNKAIFATSMRHPINLLFSNAGNGVADPFNDCGTDNIALRSLAGKMCSAGGKVSTKVSTCAPLTRDDLELAKSRARQMDVIFILEHLNETTKLGCSRLGWEQCQLETRQGHAPKVVEQLTPELWQMLWDRNKLGIELFEYMKGLAFDMLRKDGLPVPTEEDELAQIPQQDKMPTLDLMKTNATANANLLQIEYALNNITENYFQKGETISKDASLQAWLCR